MRSALIEFYEGRKMIVAICVMLITPIFATATESSFGTRVDSFLSAQARHGFSGGFVFVQNGQVVSSNAYGFANREHNAPMNLDSVYDIGSLTKQFTALAILQLVEKGDLNLQDPLIKFFPDISQDKAGITIHQLLSHSSGISEYTGNDYSFINQQDFLEDVFDRGLSSTPGSQFEYANVGYSLLGIILQQRTGMEYEAYLHTHIFKPAGMRATGYQLPDWSQLQMVKGYQGNRLWGTSLERWREDGGVSWHLKANGGLLSTLNDMVKWYDALLNNRLLSKHFTQLLFARHVPVKDGMFYGYGWRDYTLENAQTLYFHGGTNTIFFNIAMLFDDTQNSLLLFMNNAASNDIYVMPRHFMKMATEVSYTP